MKRSAKTAKEVQSDFLRMVSDFAIVTDQHSGNVLPYPLPFTLGAGTMADCISGSVYRQGLRPRDSQLEDITVGFVAGVPNQIQTGVVAICIYVPDIDPYDNGVLVENMERTAQLELIAQDWFDSIHTPALGIGYNLSLQDTITTVEDEPTHQHFVSIMLKYKYF